MPITDPGEDPWGFLPKRPGQGEQGTEESETGNRATAATGMFALLDRTPLARRISTSILREGPATEQELCARMADEPQDALLDALAVLIDEGALTSVDGLISLTQMRSTKAGARELLDRLGDL